MISDTLKIDKAWKFVQGIGLSSPGKEFYEEDSSDSGFTLHGNDIYVSDIPGTPPGVSSAIVEVVTDFVLINDISVPGNLSWYASTDGSTLEQMRATRQADWIPPRFGQGYTVVLKDNTGQQIFTTDSIDWVFDYKTGILVCEGDPDVSYALPLKLTAYRYIGERLTGIGGTAAWIDIEDVGGYFTSDNVEDALQELGLGLSTTNTNLSDHLADTVDSHDASAISVLDTADYFTGTEVEAVLAEIGLAISSISAAAEDITVADVGGYFTGTDVEAVLAEIAVEVDANTSGLATFNDHIVDAVDAHDASAISVADASGIFTAIEVEGVLSELWSGVDSNTGSILAHIHTSDEAHSAAVISIVDTLDNFTSDNVEDVLVELNADIETNTGNIANNTSEIILNSTAISDHLADTVDSHDASSISVLDVGGYYIGVEVEAVLAELAVEVDANTSGLGTLTTNFNDHLADTVDSHDASSISVLDSGANYTADNVEDALTEIAASFAAISFAAIDISVTDTAGYFTGTEVEAVLAEIGLAISTISAAAEDITVADVGDYFVGTDVEAVLAEIGLAISTISAAAVDISVADAGGYFTGDNVEDVLTELAIRVDTNTGDILVNKADIIVLDGRVDANIGDTLNNAVNIAINTVAIAANTSGVATNATNIVGNTIALNDHIIGTGSHNASGIAVEDVAELFTATDVEGVLAEIGVEVDNNIADIANNAAIHANELLAHANDTFDAHDASAISVLDSADNFVGVDVETVLAELMTGIDNNGASIIDIYDTIANLSTEASEITVLDSAENFVGDNVEDVLIELITGINNNTAGVAGNISDIIDLGEDISTNATDISTNATNLTVHINDIDDAHDASTISVLDTDEYIDATDVEDALNELVINSDDNEAKILEHEVRIFDIETGNSNTNEFTPTGTADTAGNDGDVTYDDDYVYVKTSTGWQRSALSTF